MTDSPDTTEKKSRWAEYIKNIPWLGEYLEPTDKVAVLRMAGVIADSSMMRRAGVNYNKYKEAIADAFDVPRLKAVALIINSPGGAPAQCSIISFTIRTLAAEKSVPIYAFVEDVAASGGYWLACTAEEIFVQETSIVGSIGVISASFGFDRLIERHDIDRRIHTSGKDKSFLDPFRPEKADDVSRLKDIQVDMHRVFKDWVIEQRGGRLKGSEQELMEGGFWTGRRAVELGLADGIGAITDTMRARFGEDIRFVDCTPGKKGILSSLLPFANEGRMDIDLGQITEIAEERAAWGRFGL